MNENNPAIIVGGIVGFVACVVLYCSGACELFGAVILCVVIGFIVGLIVDAILKKCNDSDRAKQKRDKAAEKENQYQKNRRLVFSVGNVYEEGFSVSQKIYEYNNMLYLEKDNVSKELPHAFFSARRNYTHTYTYVPPKTVITAATVGGITTGGVHQTAEYIKQSGTYQTENGNVCAGGVEIGCIKIAKEFLAEVNQGVLRPYIQCKEGEYFILCEKDKKNDAEFQRQAHNLVNSHGSFDSVTYGASLAHNAGLISYVACKTIANGLNDCLFRIARFWH